ncbi:MAG: response regulator transcription factor [Anaerolineales bacterium]|nr:response regulator transcription factor [Anaerolineales bacterium]
MIQTVIVAPALAVRAGLRAILEAAGDFKIVSEAARLSDLVPESQGIDLVLLQPAAMEVSSFSQEIIPPEAAILLISDQSALMADLAGKPPRAWGILPPDCREDELLAALYALDLGLVAASPHLIANLITSRPNKSGSKVDFPDLTERELQVLDLLAEGYANKQISLELGISEHTVKFHVSSIYTKLNVSNRAEAVRMGIQNGLIVI